MAAAAVLKRQFEIGDEIAQLRANFRKDSASRKTAEYFVKRADSLEQLWREFDGNHVALSKSGDPAILTGPYYTGDTYAKVKKEYDAFLDELSHGAPKAVDKGVPSKVDELLGQQRTNFRAFVRMVKNMRMDEVTEKWDIEDKLKMLHQRWKVIDDDHWQLDNLLEGSDRRYEKEFSEHEAIHEEIKKKLNQKMSTASHQYQAVPKFEIPTFNGNYAQWPAFMDLYSEAIHNNSLVPKAQKMQHLKGKLRGEAERVVQHLTVSADNYDTCWEILMHRYNNTQLLFTWQMQAFMNQPSVQQQTAHDLKKLHDTSVEAVYAIRNLGIDTTTWGPILVHILGNKLDSETYSSYMESRKEPRKVPSWDEFIEFLEGKFTALEAVGRKKQQPGGSKPSTMPAKEGRVQNKFRKFGSRVAYHAKARQTFSCPVCKGKHIIIYCSVFKRMASAAQLRTMTELNICENCLYSHNGGQCQSVKRCKGCGARHHTALHGLYDSGRVKSGLALPAFEPKAVGDGEKGARIASHVASSYNEVLLATLQIKVRAADGDFVILRCILDQGSQINLITEAAVQRLGLKRAYQSATVSGIGSSSCQSKGAVRVTCQSLNGAYGFEMEAIVMTRMLSNLPNCTFEKQQWPHLQDVDLADPDYNISRPVDMLLDAGVYADIIMQGILRGPSNAPICQETKLGWILIGNMRTFGCHAVINNIEEIAQFWENEEVSESPRDRSPEDDYCENLYKDTTRRMADGRYEVRIPMKQGFAQNLGESRSQAVGQFMQLEKRLAKDKALSESYKKFMAEYIDLHHMEECRRPLDPSCYLPHHGVLRLESTTTKLRTVFNASSPTKSGCSLNQLMERGPNLQQDIQSMILRWRMHRYAYTADIEKFYRQIRVQEQDQHLQKIVWRTEPTGPLRTYRLCTVTYGTKSAAFLSMRTILQLIEDDGCRFPIAADILRNQLYVDDLLGGSDSIEEAKFARDQLINFLRGGGFNLRKWASNHPAVLEDLDQDQVSQNMLNFHSVESNKALGVAWNPCADQFTFKAIRMRGTSDNATKRSVLSDLAKLYDPIGILAPVTMKGKLIFQQLWKQETGWEDSLPQGIQKDWDAFTSDVHTIAQIKVKRWVGSCQKVIDLCGFCDASEKGYGSVIYVRGEGEDGQIVTRLLTAKTKLAPVRKQISLPRLELLGAHLLSRLVKKTMDALAGREVRLYAWTDSTVVLGWLQGDASRWKTFVANRVADITSVIPSACWRHVRSEENPADAASRGLLPTKLLDDGLWFTGPEWLKVSLEAGAEVKLYDEPSLERKSDKNIHVILFSSPVIKELLGLYSSMARVTRVLAWARRFINNARSEFKISESYLTTDELRQAEILMVKVVQGEHFADEITQLRQTGIVGAKSRVLKLNPTLDGQGVLRVGGRLQYAVIKDAQKYPIILPSKGRLTELLIAQAHITTLHGGAGLTLNYIRNRYWILQGMRTIKERLLRCVRCHRFKAVTGSQLMADLPPARVTPSRPFTHTGVDFSGAVEVKANKGRGIKTTKGYIAVFVCMVTKAVHLELVSDLSAETFLAAFRRLSSRRGCPRHLYSDNGTNFHGAARIMAREVAVALQHYATPALRATLSQEGVEWHFNAPGWPTAGGLWERAVRSTKHHLRRVLGEQKLTYEEFSTVLAQIEACLNSRPLTPLTEDVVDLDCLTPGHFLVGGPVLASPVVTEKDSCNLRNRWQLTEKIQRDFWKRWSAEYLQTLQSRGKWNAVKENLQVGDMVLVKEDNIPPARWLLGRVTETHPGKDGNVRVVSVRTKTGQLKRPITKLSRLPLEQQEGQSAEEVQEVESQKRATGGARRTTGGRTLGSYFCYLLLLFAVCMPTTSQQGIVSTKLDSDRLVYFDKVADMQVIQDEWKMVVFYNMTTYWQGFKAVGKYADHLVELCKQEPEFEAVAAQVQHEVSEMQHFNDLLRSEHGRQTSTRKARGLVDGVGYIANTLFGVLDGRFAQKYEKDIYKLQANENHLLDLYKQQTSIIEGEYNLLQRNEKVMNKQFDLIYKYFAEQGEQYKKDNRSMRDVTVTAIVANMIMSNLRRVQQMLITLITDVKDGRVDTQLLKPDQLEEQLNVIAGQLPQDLSLPCVGTRRCVKEMYKLARVHAHLTDAYLLFEVKLPLVNNEPYELSRVVPIPQMYGDKSRQVATTAEYMAVNLKKDMVVPLSSQEVSSCVQVKEYQLLCNMEVPIYDIKAGNSLCEAQIINNKTLTNCRTVESDCRNKWVRLHGRGTWLFACCEECAARAFCPDGVAAMALRGIGIVQLRSGCLLKGDDVTLHAPNNFRSEVTVTNDYVYAQESAVNQVIEDNSPRFTPEQHEGTLAALKNKIHMVQQQQEELGEVTEYHSRHYYTLYSLTVVIILGAVAWRGYRVCWWFRGGKKMAEERQGSGLEPKKTAVEADSSAVISMNAAGHAAVLADSSTSP